MARARSDGRILPSLLDRLVDDEPGNQQELPKNRAQLLRELKANIRRDLENLLNTRQQCTSLPTGLRELEQSLVEYGLPDFTGAHVSAHDSRENLRDAIERALRRFEPRFKSVEVVAREDDDSIERTLHFRINALLDIEPAPEPLAFDSVLEPVSGNFVLTAARHV